MTRSLLALISLSSLLSSAAAAEPASWIGEWGKWETKASTKTAAPAFKGAGLKIKSCEDGKCEFTYNALQPDCKLSGSFELTSSDTAGSAKLKACTIGLSRVQEPSPSVHLEFTRCEKACGQSVELPLISAVVSADPLPWPECQADRSPTTKVLCTDVALGESALALNQVENRVRTLAKSFYIPKASRPNDPPRLLSECATGAESRTETRTDDEIKTCLNAAISKRMADSTATLAEIKGLKIKMESDLKSSLKGVPAQTSLNAIRGTYTRTFKSGSSEGDKFDVTDDAKLTAEEDELGFDVLLNFFNEQECSLSGSATPLKSGRFLFKDSGKGKGASRSCRLLIFKEGDELVITDDPPESCKSHCGKGGSFFNARFPFASRKE